MVFRCVIGGIQQMRFCYGHRRFTLYPQSVDSWNLNPDNYTDDFLKRTKDIGFDALEVGMEVLSKLGTEQKIKDFSSKLSDTGLVIGCVRAGGTLHDAQNGPTNRARLSDAIKYAGWARVEVVNSAISAPARHPGHPAGSLPGSKSGWAVSQDASRDAMLYVYDELAIVFQNACSMASDAGTDITVEVHQNSPVDNSWSALLLHEIISGLIQILETFSGIMMSPRKISKKP